MTRLVQLAYAAPAFAMALLAMPLFIYIPRFYTDEVGLGVGVVGALLLAGRVVDALTDPAIGWLSDRTRTRWGRRRPWLALSAAPLVVIAGLLYRPPVLSAAGATVWFAACFFGMAILSTAVLVPYRSLGPELTADFRERTTLFGIREGALVVGTGMAMVLPPILGLGTYVAIAAPLTLVAIAACVILVREPSHRPPPATPNPGARSALANPHFRVLLIAFTVTVFGSNTVAAVAGYYVTYVLGSTRLALFFGAFFLAGIGAMPFWLWLTGRIGRKKTWLWAYAVNTIPFMPVALLGQGDEVAFGLCFTLAGLGGVPVIALFPAMQADVIDDDARRTGRRREGLFIGLWSVAEKFAAGVAVATALGALGWTGYLPNIDQSATVKATLTGLFVGVPCLCNGIGFSVALSYSLSSAPSSGPPFTEP